MALKEFEVDVAFRVQTKVDNNRVEAHDGLVDVFIQALIVEEHTERRVFAIDFRGDLLKIGGCGLDIVHRFRQWELLELSTEFFEVSLHLSEVFNDVAGIGEHGIDFSRRHGKIARHHFEIARHGVEAADGVVECRIRNDGVDLRHNAV